MKVVLAFLLLFVGFSFDLAGKCDSYFVGNVNYRRRSHGFEELDQAKIQGCIKGCFWNETYTDDGAPKCEKCSNIEDEVTCLSHTATCQWTKSGKCTSQSCPGIAKARITLNQVDEHEIDDNSTGVQESLYRDQVKKEQECIEGSALEQKYNNLYWNDYNTASNYQNAIWNVADTCTVPGSTFGNSPYGWNYRSGSNAAETCRRYIGYNYTAATEVDYERCDRIICAVTLTNRTQQQSDCEAKSNSGCIYLRGYESDGSRDRCETANQATANTICVNDADNNRRWQAGSNNATDCESAKGCIYIRGSNSDYNRNLDGTHSNDRCVPMCTGFTAGTSTRKDCEMLGCTYAGGDLESGRNLRPGNNLRTFQDVDPCPADRHRPIAHGDFCDVNTSLALNRYDCDDRTYDVANAFSCTIESLTTEEACNSGHGTWIAPPKNCRTLPSTLRSICEFNARDRKDRIVWENLTHHGGNRRAGTKYEECVQNHYDFTDDLKRERVVGYDGVPNELSAYLTPEDHERLYGYRTPEEYCEHTLQLELQNCQRNYNTSVAACHSRVNNTKVKTWAWTRSSIDIKAARSACHRIYRCMYSKSNERCSYWSIWAFILTLVIVFLVFFVVVVVGVLVLLPKIRKGLGSEA